MFKQLLRKLRSPQKPAVQLLGERCYLRTFTRSDATALTKLLADNKQYWSVYEPIHHDSYYTIAAQRQKIAESNQLMARKREYTFGMFVGNHLVGHIALYAIKRKPYLSGFIGYAIDENYKGKGICTEAVALISKFAIQKVGLNRVEAYVSPKNIASMRVLQKNAFCHEGTMRQLLYINGVWEDHAMYALLRDDFRQTKKVTTNL